MKDNNGVISLICGIMSCMTVIVFIVYAFCLGLLSGIGFIVIAFSIVCGILSIIFANRDVENRDTRRGKVGEMLGSIAVALNIVIIILMVISFFVFFRVAEDLGMIWFFAWSIAMKMYTKNYHLK